jgi:16S rRNA (uracil1498-N3)-methyltransferase
MNLIPIEQCDITQGLSRKDFRVRHIREILKSGSKPLRLGLMDSHEIALGRIFPADTKELTYSVEILEKTTEKPSEGIDGSPIALFVGAVRPPTTERLLRDLTSLGVNELIFFVSELTEKSYLSSRIWEDQKLKENLWLGAAQGKTTYLPKVRLVDAFHKIFPLMESLGLAAERVAFLDISPEAQPLHRTKAPLEALILGPERGFSSNERLRLAGEHYPYSLGDRTLRTENAALIGAYHLLNKD